MTHPNTVDGNRGSLTETSPAIAPSVLAACPWCTVVERGHPVAKRALKSAYRLFNVECLRCESGGPLCYTEDEAITAWNRRAIAPKADLCVIEAMLAYPAVNEFVRDKEREVEGLWSRIKQIASQSDPEWAVKLAAQAIAEREA